MRAIFCIHFRHMLALPWQSLVDIFLGLVEFFYFVPRSIRSVHNQNQDLQTTVKIHWLEDHESNQQDNR